MYACSERGAPLRVSCRMPLSPASNHDWNATSWWAMNAPMLVTYAASSPSELTVAHSGKLSLWCAAANAATSIRLSPGGMGYCNPGTLPRPRGLIRDASRSTGTYLRRRLFVLTRRHRWLHSVYILGRHYSIWTDTYYCSWPTLGRSRRGAIVGADGTKTGGPVCLTGLSSVSLLLRITRRKTLPAP